MSASQRHKCEIHDFTVIAAGECPAYAADTYPPVNPVEPVDPDVVTFGGFAVTFEGEDVTHA